MTTLPNIILLVGKKRSGKDTIGDYLVKKYGYVKLALAEPIKQICKTIFGFTDEQCYGDTLKEVIDERWGITPRKAFQYIGTEIFRNKNIMNPLIKNIDDNFWIKCLHEQIESNIKKGLNVVITDVRFQNEEDGINKLAEKIGVNCKSIKISRPNLLINDEHESEKNIDSIMTNYKIINSTTIQELYNKLDNLFI
jgi:hypothetical protein